MATKTVTELEVLKKAHKYVLDSWSKGHGTKHIMGVPARCATSAIHFVAQDSFLAARTIRILADFVPMEVADKVLCDPAIQVQHFQHYNQVQHYNDETGKLIGRPTELADISELFLDAIEWLEEEA